MIELSFTSGGARCAATLYPAGTDALRGPRGRPALVMAHGFGCTRDSGLEPFAARFAAAGIDVLAFDYRGFGTSDGRPRQLVSHRRQRDDYRAALSAVRRRAGVDPGRVALWGTSYSGGHVVAVAASDPDAAAVVSQGAAVDGFAILRKPERADPSAPTSKGSRMVQAAVRDLARAGLRRVAGPMAPAPVMVDSVGAPGDFAMLTDSSSFREYLDMMGPTWTNAICARSLLGVPFNRPVRQAHRVRCPTLLVVAQQDAITPADAIRRTAARMGPHAQVLAFDCAHFDIYRGPVFEASVAVQVDFLSRHLQP